MKLMPSFSLSRSSISLVLAMLAAVALMAISQAGYVRSTVSLDSMREEIDVRTTLNAVLQHMIDAETGQRGYLLTGDPRYLEPYRSAAADISVKLEGLRRAYAHHPAEQHTLEGMMREIQRKLTELELTVRMRMQGNEEAWKFVLTTDVGKEHMDAFRRLAARLIESSAKRMEIDQAQIRRSLLWSGVGIACVAAMAMLAFYLYLRQTNALKLAGEREQRALQQERDLLGRQVRDRTATLAELATHLQEVRETERAHLARELHDELGALLTAAKLDVARLKSRIGASTPEVAQRLQHLTETLNSGIALKRRIIEDLRPSSLSNLGLVASLEILGREFSERSGIEVSTALDEVELDESSQLTVYRLVQESLTNVAKYAQARRATVSLRDIGDHVEIEVGDDGQGFDPETIRPQTHGLAGMRHRVEAAGGRLRVASSPGNGARISAALPVRAPEPRSIVDPLTS